MVFTVCAASRRLKDCVKENLKKKKKGKMPVERVEPEFKIKKWNDGDTGKVKVQVKSTNGKEAARTHQKVVDE